MVDLVTPGGEPADPDWLGDVDDSAPDPGPDLPEDSIDTSNPDGSPTDPDWLGDVDDSAPDPDGGTDGPAVIGIIPDGGNDGLLAGVGVGVLGLLLGVVALVMGGED
jgi:hypothetical protein